MYERNLKKEDRNQLFNIKDFKQVQAIEYLSALLIILKDLMIVVLFIVSVSQKVKFCNGRRKMNSKIS